MKDSLSQPADEMLELTLVSNELLGDAQEINSYQVRNARALAKTHGSTMMHLTKAGMEKYPMVLPPITEQRRIAEVLFGIDSKVELLRALQTQFETLKRGLMQKLLTGEWRVKVDAESAA